ncbi:phenylacetate--CoA ligase family protein [Bacillus massiliigorillae]|uniref:phenylacetate--CoA ligase family protein n=1 Tax=Bacillus massiliigorillae TaxID=1243664 RepID=UPI0003A18275|nr:phenylacetate--CoA ligase family protein [Bacillus massiliigorillae]
MSMGNTKEKLARLRLHSSGNTLENLSQLEESQWLTHQQVQILQQKHLTNLINHAYENVPYYQDNIPIKSIFDAKGLVDLRKFSTIPILTKKIIRKHFDQLKSNHLQTLNWYENTSGGSTGEPVVFIQDSSVREWEQSVKILFDKWSGRLIGDKQVRLWGSERDLLVGKESMRSQVGKWMRNEVWLNTFSMSDEIMLSYVEKINTFQPLQILAYVESIFDLAQFIIKNKLQVFSPKSIMVSAGTLFPYMREVIEAAFKAPVFNRYGSREVGDIACECERHKGLHISSPTHFVEILREDGSSAEPGEVGEIVITSLMNYGMPLIRYRIEDMGCWAEDFCSCGSGWPLLKEVTGKVTDTFLTKDHKPVNAVYFEFLFYYQDWIRKFQIIQEDYELIKINIVLTDMKQENPFEIYHNELEKIIKEIKIVMGEKCVVQFDFVLKINASPSGKYRFLISNIKRNE